MKTITDRRLSDGRRATDKRRALSDWGTDLACYVHAALDARTTHGTDLAFEALIVDVLRLAKDLGIEGER